MTINDLIEQIKKFEGYREKAYLCPSGIATIGYGRTSGVKLGQVTTKEEEDAWLHARVTRDYEHVKNKMGVYGYGCTQNQLLSLTDFVFNLGIGKLDSLTNFGKRTLEEIGAKIIEYNKANGKKLSGLVKRREWEQALFLKKDIEHYTKADMWIYISGYECKGLLKFTGFCTSLNNVDYALFEDRNGIKIRIKESEISTCRFVGVD